MAGDVSPVAMFFCVAIWKFPILWWTCFNNSHSCQSGAIFPVFITIYYLLNEASMKWKSDKIINSQSLEDTQVRYILQKYVLDKYTLEWAFKPSYTFSNI